MKKIIIHYTSFVKKNNLLKIRSFFSYKPFQIIVVKNNLSKLGNCNWIIFSNGEIEPIFKKFPFCKQVFFKDSEVPFDKINLFLDKSQFKELEKRKLLAQKQQEKFPEIVKQKEKVIITIGYVMIIYPPLYRLIHKNYHYSHLCTVLDYEQIKQVEK